MLRLITCLIFQFSMCRVFFSSFWINLTEMSQNGWRLGNDSKELLVKASANLFLFQMRNANATKALMMKVNVVYQIGQVSLKMALKAKYASIH